MHLPPLAQQRYDEPRAAQDRSYNGVRQLYHIRGIRHFQPKPAVHNAQNDEQAAVDQVQVRDKRAALLDLEYPVVKPAEDGLEDDEDEDHDADDGVVFRVGVVDLSLILAFPTFLLPHTHIYIYTLCESLSL